MATLLPNVMDKYCGMTAFLDKVMESLSKCHPPCRFLVLAMSVGKWVVMDDAYARRKIEETFHECMGLYAELGIGGEQAAI